MAIVTTRIGKSMKFEELNMRIEVGAEEVDAAFKSAYDTVRNRVEIDGYRKGKAPDDVLKQKYGEEIIELIKHTVYTESLIATIEREKMQVVGKPQAQIVTKQLERGKPVVFQVHAMTVLKEPEEEVTVPPMAGEGKVITPPAGAFKVEEGK